MEICECLHRGGLRRVTKLQLPVGFIFSSVAQVRPLEQSRLVVGTLGGRPWKVVVVVGALADGDDVLSVPHAQVVSGGESEFIEECVQLGDTALGVDGLRGEGGIRRRVGGELVLESLAVGSAGLEALGSLLGRALKGVVLMPMKRRLYSS